MIYLSEMIYCVGLEEAILFYIELVASCTRYSLGGQITQQTVAHYVSSHSGNKILPQTRKMLILRPPHTRPSQPNKKFLKTVTNGK